MLRRILPVLLLVLAIPVFGFGCKGLSKEERAATQPVKLEYWTVFDDVDALQQLINAYRADRPYLTVNVRQLRLDEFYPRLVEALAEDRGPDIISVRNRWLRFYQSKLSPMPPVVDDTKVRIEKGKLGTNTIVTTVKQPLPTINNIEREYVQAVKSDVVIDNKIYGLPLSLDTMALYYNKDLLDKAGVPEAPKTWEEFQVAVKKITKYDQRASAIVQSGAALGTGANIPGFEDILYILFKQSGVEFVNRQGAPTFHTVRTPAGQANPAFGVMHFYTDFANPTRDTYTWDENIDNAFDRFINGSLAFFFGYNYHYSLIKARAPQLNVEAIPMLQLNPEQPVNVANYWVQTVTDKSKHKNEAWGLVNYLTHSRATKDYLDRANRPSALRAYISDQLDKPELQPFSSQLLIAESWYKGRNYDGMVKALADMTAEWLQSPPRPDQENEFRQQILNRAAAKFAQTL